MCGIAGFISPHFTEEDLGNITQKLSHRGPDADGLFFDVDQHIGLGHRRLSILDLSESANQPFVSHCGRYVMVYNGEVYNFREIRARISNRNWKTEGDTEVILEAYVEWGARAVEEFNGMFAIAIWDKQIQQLQLFRDRIGIKPIYYYYKNGVFAFSSETKSLLSLPIPRKINQEALKDYLFLEYIPAGKSIIQDIYKLEQGCQLTIQLNQEPVIYKWYDLLSKINTERQDLGESHYLEEFDHLISDSIKLRSISDVPIGAFLSGGTDSSIICAKFQETIVSPINTFTIGFDIAAYDESNYANRVAEKLKSNHTLEQVNAKSSLSLIEKIVSSYDEPFAAPSTIPSLLVCEKARKLTTVALSGDGGDELFMGYGYYDWFTRAQKVTKIGNIGRQVISIFSKLGGNRIERIGRVFNYPSNQAFWLHVWSQEQYMFNEAEIQKLFGEKYTHQSLIPSWNHINQLALSNEEKISLFDLLHYLPQNLLYKMDIASMSSSLEVRVPLLDHRLVEFAINLPLSYKIKNNEKKYLMKKYLEKYLPQNLIYRKKWGFPAPIGNWLQNELAYLIDKYLNTALLQKQDIFNPHFVQKLIKEFRQGKMLHFKRIWALIVFEMWYNEYIEQIVE